MAMVWVEGLRKLKTFSDLIGTRARDLLACSMVPQPTALPRASYLAAFSITGVMQRSFPRPLARLLFRKSLKSAK
jgi:hypothetical protein